MSPQTPLPGPLYIIRETPSSGKAVFVAPSVTSIPRGTLVLEDTPLFTIPQSARSVEDVQGRVKRLDKDGQRAFLGLSNWRAGEKEVGAVMGVFKTNVLPAGPDESAIFPLASRLNHSCVPNTEHHFHPSTRTLQIRTLCSLNPDEEITISYLSTRLLLPAAERKAHLKASFGFDCVCPACSSPTLSSSTSPPPSVSSSSSSSDENRSQITTLKASIDSLFPTSPQAAYDASLSLLELCEAESLVVEGAFARATLAQIVIMWGGADQLAERWVEEAWREFVVCRGEEGEDARRWARWRGGKVSGHPRKGCLGVCHFKEA